MTTNAATPVPGQAYIEFSLETPNQNTSAANLTTAPETSRVFETVFGYNETDISFKVTTPQFLDQVLRMLDAEGDPVLNWRMGIGTANQVDWLPWQRFYVIQYTARFEGVGPAAGHYIKLFARDALHKSDRSKKVRTFKGTVSSVVKTLADDSEVKGAVIEDTHGQGLWVQSYEGNFEFVRSRLVARARSTRGRGNYYLYVRDNVLHFHTVEYQTVIKDFAYYLSPATRLEAIDVAEAKLPDGAAGVRVIYYDPYTGISKEVNSDPTQAIRMGNFIPRLDQIEGAQRNLREHRIQTRDEESGSTALAQNAYECARAECFQLKMQTSKTAFLRAGELLRINIDPNAQNTSTWSGLYLVVTGHHAIDKGELTSVYILQRGEQQVSQLASNSLASYGVETLNDDQTAPGYAINTQDAQSSAVTKGAGNASTGGNYLTTQDPNS